MQEFDDFRIKSKRETQKDRIKVSKLCWLPSVMQHTERTVVAATLHMPLPHTVLSS